MPTGIVTIDVREIAFRRRHSFVSSRATTDDRRIILITTGDSNGTRGWGECSAPEEPRYCEEWTASAWEFINSILVPAVLEAPPTQIASLQEIFGRFRGNRMAKAAVEEAYCDFEARQKGVPLWRFLGGSAEPIPCGVAIGIMSSIDDLLALVEKEVSSGYRRIKLKIQRGWDVAVVAAVRRTFPALALMVDANGAYTLDDIDALAQLDAYDLLMLEQPFAPDDLWAFKQAHDRFNTPICLDESIVSLASTRAALKLGLCSMVNIKLGRVGGHSVAREIVNLCTSEGIPCWCGGQHEAGIGRAHNLAMASLIPRIVPAELSASERYWDEDIISPPIQVDNKGYLQPPTAPGLGFVVNEDLVLQCTVRETHHQG